jgi:arylsulfatase A-like enzyme
MRILQFIFLTGVTLLASGTTSSSFAKSKTPDKRPPNVILILADDLGWGDLACYGNKAIKTPNLDSMASEGLRFTQCYAGSTVCSPSRAVLFTGIHTGHAYQRANDAKDMRKQDVTFAMVLKQAGYATGLIGKWGLAGPHTDGAPTKKGFDVFYGYYGNNPAHNYYPRFLWRGDKKEPLGNEGEENKNGGGVATKKVRYSNDAFYDEGAKFIDEHAKKTEPFLLCLTFTIPHANNEAGKATGNGLEVPDLGEYANKTNWPDVRKSHAAMVTRLDGYVGKILAQLKQLGIDENTLVLFTSDNGPHAEGGYNPYMNDSNGPLRGHKRDLYEGGIREPLIARWPGHVKSGTTSDEIVWFADVLPTLAQLANVDATKLPRHDGLSIVPTLLGNSAEQKHHDYLYWEFYEQGGKQAVRAGDWKAVRMPMFTGKTELYNVKTDVSEKKDVSAEHPDVVKRLETLMQEAHTPPDEPSKRERAVIDTK